MRDKIIRIHWSKPTVIEEVILSSSKEQGLYYITRLFGTKETSLYIGKSASSIKRRLNSHDWVHNYRGKILVRIGKIIYPKYPSPEIIDHAESALIFEHKDILKYNTDKRNSYSYINEYRIENTGDFFELSPIIRMQEQLF